MRGTAHSCNSYHIQAVYFYEPEGRGPCFAFEGEKKMLSWFRGYLIVVSQQEVAR